jgi:hypothetical protein
MMYAEFVLENRLEEQYDVARGLVPVRSRIGLAEIGLAEIGLAEIGLAEIALSKTSE